MTGRRDNVRTIDLGGKSYDIEASLGAGIAYRNEFFGKLEDPYVGSFEDDLLRVWSRSQQMIEDVDENGNEIRVPNQDYAGLDTLALLRLTWAMWAACDPKATTWKAFEKTVLHANVSAYEQTAMFVVVVKELGGGCTFRKPKGQDGADAADKEQES